MKNAGKLSILLPLSLGFCATVLAVAGGLSANVAYANEANEASAASAANLNEVHGNKKESNSSQEEADKYPTVTFMNGDSTIATVQVKKGKTTGEDTPSDLKDTGYTFIGWSTTKGATSLTQVDFKSDTAVNANTTVYAVFAKDDNEPAKKHTVTFKIDDACFDTASVENGKTIGNSMPSAPSKTGYTFLGWSTTKGATEQSKVDFTDTTAVSSDTNVYAVFKRDVVMLTVTFKSSRDSSVIKVERGQKVTSTPSVAAPVGYNFVRWSTSPNGTGSAFDSNKRITEDIIVYAIFKKKPGIPEPTPTPIPDDPPLPPNPDRPDPDDPLNPGGGLTQKYSVTFMNGDNVISTVNVERGETVKSADMPKNLKQDGYTFLGWSTKKNTSDKADVDFTSTTQVYDDKTVYAVFEKIPVVMYDVTFKNDDAWLSTIYVEKGKKLDSDRFPANPTKTGYDFVGWSTNKNASAADFSADSSINADTTVYAVFEAKPYKLSHSVTFKNDGSWIKTVTVKDGETVTEENMPSTHAKTGYKFVGWSTTDGASEANFTANTAVSSDKTVYAVFKKDEHTVKVEVLVAKMTYKGSSDLTFNTTKKTSDPVDGKKVTDGNGNVTHNTPATDGVTEVGNKQVVEGVPLKQNYDIVSDPKMDFGKSRVVDGEDISSSIVTIYKVDSNRGLTDEIESEKTEYSTPSVKSCIYVGNVKKETKDIPFKTTYVSNDSLSYKSENVKIDGKSGKKNITTTYKLSDNPDANYIGDVDSAHEVVTNPVVDKVIEVGNIDKKTTDIPFKTTYVADSSLDYNTQQDKTTGKNGSKTVTTTYKVDKTTGLTTDVDSTKEEKVDPTDCVIRVGNKEVKTEDIEPGTTYEADSSLTYKQEQTTEGTKGTKTTTTTYKVDENKGLTDEVDGTPKVETKAAKDKVIKVGNVKTETTDIDFQTTYEDDNALDEGTEKTKTEGKKGSKTVTTTYEVDKTKGLTTKATKTETQEVQPTNKVVLRGTKKKTPPAPQPPVQNQKTVTFNKKDGSLLTTVKVETGKKVAAASMPAAPVEDGFTFKEWNTQQDGQGKAFTADTVVSEDLTVYAVYTKNNAPQPPTPPDTDPSPDPTDSDDNNGGGSIDPDWTYNPELNIGVGNDNNNSANSNGSINDSANGSDSTSGSDALQAEVTRSAYALPNTGSNASGTTFASFGAMVLGLFVASGAAVNRKRAKHLR